VHDGGGAGLALCKIERCPNESAAERRSLVAMHHTAGMSNDASPPTVGTAAPDFTLPDSQNTPRHLAELCAEHPLVLVFYRGHW
jgi:AhpC/TSA family